GVHVGCRQILPRPLNTVAHLPEVDHEKTSPLHDRDHRGGGACRLRGPGGAARSVLQTIWVGTSGTALPERHRRYSDRPGPAVAEGASPHSHRRRLRLSRIVPMEKGVKEEPARTGATRNAVESPTPPMAPDSFNA